MAANLIMDSLLNWPLNRLNGSPAYELKAIAKWLVITTSLLQNQLMVCCALCLPFAASAQEVLSDPTRVPTELASPSPLAASGVPVIASPVNVLRSVIISPTSRAAIINGQLVKLGDSVGDATLAEINEGNVVLQSVRGKQVLTLFPNVEIKKKESLKPEIKQTDSVLKKMSDGKKKRSNKSASHTVQPKKIEGGGK
jgi:MSHA biogenesis protein MshK